MKRRDLAVLVAEVAFSLTIVAGLCLWLVPVALVVAGMLGLAFTIAWERSQPDA